MTTVVISDEPVSLEDLVAIVVGAHVAVDDTVRARMAASRAVVEHALAADEAVYGLTTRVGHTAAAGYRNPMATGATRAAAGREGDR